MNPNEQALMERYIYQVTRRLSKNQRKEVALELEELIGDMLESTGSMEAVLTKLGDPKVFARKYQDDRHYLIGPEYFDAYLWFLKIVLLCTAVPILLVSIIEGVQTADVYKGSRSYLPDETTPVPSDAAADLISRAKKYTPENPLYIVAIGAITNIASALLFDPSIAQNIVIVWLGGHAQHYAHTKEFNMMQDYDAANVVLKSEAAFVQLPCNGVVSECRISKPELEHWLVGKNELADYLAQNTIHEADSYALGKPWTRVIWDVTAVAWLLNDQNRFMEGRIINAPVVTHAGEYLQNPNGKPMQYVFHIKRDALMEDLINKLTGDH